MNGLGMRGFLFGFMVLMVAGAGGLTAQANKPAKLFLVKFNEAADSESGENAIRVGLKQSGLVENLDYTLKVTSAQGDMPTLISLVDSAVADNVDILIPLQSVSLQATVERAKGKPVVFHLVSDPILLGVATSDTDHLPNVTGAYIKLDPMEIQLLLNQLTTTLPDVKTIGTLYVPGEVISNRHRELLEEGAKKAGLQVKAVPVDTVNDLGNAVQSLISANVGAIVMVDGSIPNGLAEAVLAASNKAKIPVFGFTAALARKGAVFCIVPDVGAGGRAAGKMVADILKGRSPKDIPFYLMPSGNKLVNPAAAKKFGLDLTASTVKGATEVVAPGTMPTY
jgi:putative ABC transport system substrate-binding protein